VFANVLEELFRHLLGHCFGSEVTTAVTMKSVDFWMLRRAVRRNTDVSVCFLPVSAGSLLGFHFDSENGCSMFLRNFKTSNPK
jgi:hypothetical protein